MRSFAEAFSGGTGCAARISISVTVTFLVGIVHEEISVVENAPANTYCNAASQSDA